MRSGRLMYYSRHCKTGRGCSPSCGARERIPGVRPGTRRVNSWQSGRRPVVRPALAPNAITRPSKAGDEGVAGALVSTRTARITRVSSDSAQMLREFSAAPADAGMRLEDRKSTRLNSSHGYISYAVFCLKKKKKYIDIILCNIHRRTSMCDATHVVR